MAMPLSSFSLRLQPLLLLPERVALELSSSTFVAFTTCMPFVPCSIFLQRLLLDNPLSGTWDPIDGVRVRELAKAVSLVAAQLKTGKTRLLINLTGVTLAYLAEVATFGGMTEDVALWVEFTAAKLEWADGWTGAATIFSTMMAFLKNSMFK